MRILAIYRHYWPDTTPYARLLRTILEHRAAQGDKCAVFTCQPSYNDNRAAKQPSRETLGGVRIVRGWTPPERKRFLILRAIAAAWFLASAVIFAWRRRREFDVVLANVHPPVLMGWTLRLIRLVTGLPYILHVQDIHPEALQAVDAMRDSMLARWIRRSDAATCQHAWRLVTLSDDMATTLRQRPGCDQLDTIRISNNFPLELYGARRVSEEHVVSIDAESPFVVLFAGNLGRFQALPRLIEAAAELVDTPIEFVLMGAGAVLHELRNEVSRLQLPNVRFVDQQPVEAAFAAMKMADLGVVSLAPGVCRVAYPSKSMTYLAAGLPLLALIEADSDLAREVERFELGYAPGQVDGKALANVIRNAWQNRAIWSSQRRKKLAETAERIYGKARALREWDEIAVEWERQPKDTLTDDSVRRAA